MSRTTAPIVRDSLGGAYIEESMRAIWVKITGSTSIGTNRWRYNGTEQQPIDEDFEDHDNGRTLTCLNTVEANNTGAGVEGHGVDVDGADYPAGFDVQPIATNAIVRCFPVRVDVGSDRETQWWFSLVNADDGTCT